ncbi:hypothetical protein ACFWFZ_23800 [Streptomyces sp. NPDC060232]|uniref:hypothetical protein n=1 Tax=Streptomyces sp. NPDC060232 TaxID=3347079 RepID=UPI003669358A
MTDHKSTDIHNPIVLTHPTAPVVPFQPPSLPDVQTVQLPDGRLITGYALTPVKDPEPHRPRPVISPLAVNIALGGIGFAAACGGLMLLTTFIAAVAALVQQLVILAAVVFGGFIATQVLGSHHGRDRGTVVNIRRAVFKRNHFHS